MRCVRRKARRRPLHGESRVPARVARRRARSRPSARSRGRIGSAVHRAGYSRSYLPHFDAPGVVQGITIRLADSLPGKLVQRWREEIRNSNVWGTEEARVEELRRRVARHEDAGWGECHLRRPQIAALVQDALLRFDGERYRLLEWCVMPNHVHVLMTQIRGFPLGDIVRSWKTFTAREANAVLGRRGPFWMREYHDRSIRDPRHLERAVAYIRGNPVQAGLCARAEDWPWSSATRQSTPGSLG